MKGQVGTGPDEKLEERRIRRGKGFKKNNKFSNQKSITGPIKEKKKKGLIAPGRSGKRDKKNRPKKKEGDF